MIRRAPIARSMAMDNFAFSKVLRDSHSKMMAEAGTPAASSNFLWFRQSPEPLRMILGAAPAVNNSTARLGRSSPPPGTTIASAVTVPLSSVNMGLAKSQPTMISSAKNKSKTGKAFRIICRGFITINDRKRLHICRPWRHCPMFSPLPGLTVTNGPRHSASMSVRRKQFTACCGVSTTGSFSLKLVLSTTATPLFCANVLMRS